MIPETQPMFLRNTLPPSSWLKSKHSLLLASCWFLTWLALQPWRWWQHVPPKQWLIFIQQHGIISQNSELFRIHISQTGKWLCNSNFHQKLCSCKKNESEKVYITQNIAFSYIKETTKEMHTETITSSSSKEKTVMK